MKSYRQILSDSWVQNPVPCRILAQLLHMPLPVTVATLLNKLQQPETITLDIDVVTGDGVPLGGSAEITIRSNGSYTFKGNMRATGFPSYHFGLQVFVKAADGVMIACFHSGRVFGTDTPGDRNNSWEENLHSPLLTARWLSLRNNPRIEYQLNADISGVTGTLWDIVTIGLKTMVAYIATGPTGAVLVLGNEFASAVGIPTPPGLVVGIVVAEGVILLFGTSVIIAAGVIGAAVGIPLELAIKNRLIRDEEKEFARLIFGNVLDEEFNEGKVWITNLSYGGGRKYTYPSIDGSILLNLNDAYEDPINYSDPNSKSNYTQPGSLFAHELTHACQIAANKFVPGLICTGPGSYTYHVGEIEADRLSDTSWTSFSWTDNWFSREKQASVVDDWYGAHCRNKDGTKFTGLEQLAINLNTPEALSDPAFPFIMKCRAGIF